MKDPPRLQDECRSPLERALLRAGMSYRSSPQARIKTLAAFGFASSVAVTAGTASPAVLGGLTWAKLAARAQMASISWVSSGPLVAAASALASLATASTRSLKINPWMG